MKQFLAICAAVAAGYYIAQNFFIDIIDKDGEEIYSSPEYHKRKKKRDELELKI